jgi:hypothetical protein
MNEVCPGAVIPRIAEIPVLWATLCIEALHCKRGLCPGALENSFGCELPVSKRT